MNLKCFLGYDDTVLYAAILLTIPFYYYYQQTDLFIFYNAFTFLLSKISSMILVVNVFLNAPIQYISVIVSFAAFFLALGIVCPKIFMKHILKILNKN